MEESFGILLFSYFFDSILTLVPLPLLKVIIIILLLLSEIEW